MDSLDNTPDAWARQLVSAVARGDVAAFEAVRAAGPPPELRRADHSTRQKLRLSCLTEMAFNRTSAQRKLTFAEIAREARLPENEVELLVMKALAEKLIRGHIDQVSSTVTVSWVRPRALPRSARPPSRVVWTPGGSPRAPRRTC
ncbi:26S proteasome non-ATPase regulatory subunit 13-like [Choristoneura fumiferana]|uniref:26S proteasome non-ATPase regulatory subunit 13-like n=1 Tax=Choristoneura fumiferana TaxID=7141 RepID=UPI003D15650B